MKKLLNIPSLIITVLMTAVLAYFMAEKNIELAQIIISSILFFLLNYVILSLVIKGIAAMVRVLRLPGLKAKTYAYHLYPLAMIVLYAGFLMIMARLARYFVPSYLLVASIMGGVVLGIIAQLGGAFPSRKTLPRKTAIRVDKVGGKHGGFEVLGSFVGEYRDGVVLGVDTVEYNQLEDMHRSKDSIVIEGSDDNKLEIIVLAEKAQAYLIDLLADRLGVNKDTLTPQAAERKEAKMKAEKSLRGRKRTKPIKLIKAQEAAKQQALRNADRGQGKE